MRECDLIMKGGITSGVVFSRAIVEIAREYRLRSIGGTSAGAIGAVMAAAAEYRRRSSEDGESSAGYDALATLATDLGGHLSTLFQPSKRLAPLFGILLAIVDDSSDGSVAWKIVRAIWKPFYIGIVIAFLPGLLVALGGTTIGELWLAVLGIVIGLVSVVGILLFLFYRMVFVDLAADNFGVCSGLTIPGRENKALTDWMADKIDEIAGKDGGPLTIGDLEGNDTKRTIKLAAMTTDLSSGRPYELPLQSNVHFFSRREFETLFPERIVDYLVGDRSPLEVAHAGMPDDLYPLPTGGDFPVLLVARMSLSFPGLIQAVPLYRTDGSIDFDTDARRKMRKCLFSDGGISSNFPIHFFDSFLPSRPTFGIALTDWCQERHGDVRVAFTQTWPSSSSLPVRKIKGFFQFLYSIVNTAKDWQDTLQARLTGYSERIVEIRLDEEKEGGLNLNMDRQTIERLEGYGREAGEKLVKEFNFDEHRWLRALSFMSRLEGSLETLSERYNSVPVGADKTGMTYRQILTEYPAVKYTNTDEWRRNVLDPFVRKLSDMGKKAGEDCRSGEGQCVRDGNVPKTLASIRLIADAQDRGPSNDPDNPAV